MWSREYGQAAEGLPDDVGLLSPASDTAATDGGDCIGEGGVRGGEEEECVGPRDSASEKPSVGVSVRASEIEETTEDLLLVQSLCQPSAQSALPSVRVRCCGTEAVSKCNSEQTPLTVM